MGRISNMLLCLRYPFLRIPGMYFSETWYDDVLTGWQKGFGRQMLRDIRKACVKTHSLHRMKILEVKEKWGMLDIICICQDEVQKAVMKWEDLSRSYCCLCGKPATEQTDGWIRYYCKDCYDRYFKEGDEYDKEHKETRKR